jgi:hypothetical protein
MARRFGLSGPASLGPACAFESAVGRFPSRTNYDSSDLDRRRPVGVARLASAKPADDPNEPKITKIGSVFVDRGNGIGRIRIYGKKFGIQDVPPFSVDDYLCNCHERLNFKGFRVCGILGDDQAPRHQDPSNQDPSNQDPSGQDPNQTASPTPGAENDDYAKVGEAGGPDALKRRVEKKAEFCCRWKDDWEKYQAELRSRITVNVNSRNPGIRVEKAEVIDANDEMIDIYFEFTRHRGYAWPFRPAGVDLTINKIISKAEQTVKAEAVLGEVDVKTLVTFTLSRPIGQETNRDLVSQYTVLDQQEARSQLGQGVADNFYVVVLSVVNNGKKTIAMPLAAIQVEVEWLYGFDPKLREENVSGQKVRDFYIDGPPTVAPIPLAAV